MKRFLLCLGTWALVFGMMESASADTIFEDDFARASYPQNDLGPGWTKTFNDQTGDVQLRAGNATYPGILWLRDIGASATQQVSTAGFTNISLSFVWRGNAPAEPGDTLHLSWFDGSTSHDSGLSLSLTNQTPTTITYDFAAAAANLAGFSFTFYTTVNAADEAARIQYVSLTGDSIASVPAPEPGTLALLGLGMAGLGWRHRRKLRAKAP